jgi:hypothetical protein
MGVILCWWGGGGWVMRVCVPVLGGVVGDWFGIVSVCANFVGILSIIRLRDLDLRPVSG